MRLVRCRPRSRQATLPRKRGSDHIGISMSRANAEQNLEPIPIRWTPPSGGDFETTFSARGRRTFKCSGKPKFVTSPCATKRRIDGRVTKLGAFYQATDEGSPLAHSRKTRNGSTQCRNSSCGRRRRCRAVTLPQIASAQRGRSRREEQDAYDELLRGSRDDLPTGQQRRLLR